MKHSPTPTPDPNLLLEPIISDEGIEQNRKEFRLIAGAAVILYGSIVTLSAISGYLIAKQEAQMEAAQTRAQILKLHKQIQEERDSIVGITDTEVEAIEAMEAAKLECMEGYRCPIGTLDTGAACEVPSKKMNLL